MNTDTRSRRNLTRTIADGRGIGSMIRRENDTGRLISNNYLQTSIGYCREMVADGLSGMSMERIGMVACSRPEIVGHKIPSESIVMSHNASPTGI